MRVWVVCDLRNPGEAFQNNVEVAAHVELDGLEAGPNFGPKKTREKKRTISAQRNEQRDVNLATRQ